MTKVASEVPIHGGFVHPMCPKLLRRVQSKNFDSSTGFANSSVLGIDKDGGLWAIPPEDVVDVLFEALDIKFFHCQDDEKKWRKQMSMNAIKRAEKFGQKALDAYREEFSSTPADDGPKKVGDWDMVAWQLHWKHLQDEGVTDADYDACLTAWRRGFQGETHDDLGGNDHGDLAGNGTPDVHRGPQG